MDIGKDLVAASATPLVLAILSEGESYGYAIIKRVDELSGGELQWTDGMLYPVLHRLERNGLVKAAWGRSETGRRRKYYRLTDQGSEELANQRRQWQVVNRGPPLDPVPVVSTRAAGNLMPHPGGVPVLDERIGEWRAYVQRRQAIEATDVDELEDHLRSQVSDLQEAGLDPEEAFLIGVKRMGELDTLSREFAREHSERLWKRLVVEGSAEGGTHWGREALVAVGLAVAAAVAIKVPELFGLRIMDGGPAAESFYMRHASLFVLPFLAGYFAWKRGMGARAVAALAAPFVLGALAVNLLPFTPLGNTEVLAALHLPMALWLAVGVGYAGGAWRSHDQRMNYVRFSGEWFIYYALIALGGGVLMGFTAFVFNAIGLDPEFLLTSWILPCGVVGAVLIAGWLVEAKQSVIENMAPVLTLLFTPLFTLLLLAFLATMIWTGSGIDVEREVLIGFDLLLVLVVGLLLYSISARDPQREPGFFDALQLVLVICALVVDALALWAILARISTFGFSPNRVAALGENLILVVNLGWSAVLYARFVAKRAGFGPLERWQTAYLPVYAVWAWVVVVVFPLVFRS